MKLSKEDLKLYLVTDRSWTSEKKLEEQVEEALENGVTFLQLREKELPYDEFLESAFTMKRLAQKYKVPFVINDNVDVAVKCNCDGVHIGQDDMKVCEARELIGKDKILGVSVSNVQEAEEAENAGADYLGVGAMFTTETKGDAYDISLSELESICGKVTIPVVAIGGINPSNIEKLKGTGIAGVAVVSAILAQKNIPEATSEINGLCEESFYSVSTI